MEGSIRNEVEQLNKVMFAWQEYALGKAGRIVEDTVLSKGKKPTAREIALIGVASNVLAATSLPPLIKAGGMTFYRLHEMEFLRSLATWPIIFKSVLLSGAGGCFQEAWATAGYDLNTASSDGFKKFVEISDRVRTAGLAELLLESTGELVQWLDDEGTVISKPDKMADIIPKSPEVIVFGDSDLGHYKNIEGRVILMPWSIRKAFLGGTFFMGDSEDLHQTLIGSGVESSVSPLVFFQEKPHQDYLNDSRLSGLLNLAAIFRLSPESLIDFNPERGLLSREQLSFVVRQLLKFSNLANHKDGTVLFTIGSGDINRTMYPLGNRFLIMLALEQLLDRLNVPYVFVDYSFLAQGEYPYFQTAEERYLSYPKGLGGKMSKNAWDEWTFSAFMQMGSLAMLTFKVGDLLKRSGSWAGVEPDEYAVLRNQAAKREFFYYVKREIYAALTKGEDPTLTINRSLGMRLGTESFNLPKFNRSLIGPVVKINGESSGLRKATNRRRKPRRRKKRR